MAKKSIKVAATYFITLVITLAVVGAAGYYLANSVLNGGGIGSKVKETSDYENVTEYDDFTPTDADKKTLLIIADLDKRSNASCFVLVRHVPAERRLVVMTLPSDTFADVNGLQNSVYEFYRTEGVLSTVKAVENACGLTVDKYLKFNKKSFKAILDIFHGVEYDIPYNLIYEDPNGDDIVFREGRSYLNSDSIVKVLSFPKYKSGEEYRAKTATILLTDLLNKNIASGFADHIDDYFSMVINDEIETNITSYDYNEHAAALKYTANNPDRIVKNVFVSGAYDDNDRFWLDENFVKSLKESFKLYTIE